MSQIDFGSASLLAGRQGPAVDIVNEHRIAYGCTACCAHAPSRSVAALGGDRRVGSVCACLVSDVAQAVTRDVHYVDGTSPS